MGTSSAAAEVWDRTARDQVLVTGADAASFLQGQLSQDVAALGVGATTWSLLLAPSGKLEAWVRVRREAEDRFALEVDAGFGDRVADRLRRFLLRIQATVEVVPSNGSAPAPAAVEIARIEAGVPTMGAEITEEVIPAELGQWVIDSGVSFTKGCFTGQELVARVDSRGGNVPRHLRGLVLDAPVAPGDPIRVGDREVGHITSAAVSPSLGPIALAFVHRSVDPPAAVTVGDGSAGAGIVTGEVRTLPLAEAQAAG